MNQTRMPIGRRQFLEKSLVAGAGLSLGVPLMAKQDKSTRAPKKKRGLKLIVIDPRKAEVARFADVYLQPRPGEDSAILAAMLHVILREERYDVAFCEAHVFTTEII